MSHLRGNILFKKKKRRKNGPNLTVFWFTWTSESGSVIRRRLFNLISAQVALPPFAAIMFFFPFKILN